VTAQTLATEKTFIQNVIAAIAKALAVEVENVVATIQVARRLEDVPSEATSSTNLQVTYKVDTALQDEASKMESLMKNSSSREEFAQTFKSELLEREVSSGRIIVIDEIQASEIKVDIISDNDDVYGVVSPSPAPSPPSTSEESSPTSPAPPPESESNATAEQPPNGLQSASSNTVKTHVMLLMKPVKYLMIATIWFHIF